MNGAPVGLRLRVFGALGLLLACTVLGVWVLLGGGVLRPVVHALVQERANTAAFAASEIERASDPRHRARELGRELDLEFRLERGPPPDRRAPRVYEAHGREVLVPSRPGSPVFVPLRGPGDAQMLAVRFPTDLETARRRVGGGLALLALAAVGAGWFASRWVLRPLATMQDAMGRVERGELGHRLAEGTDAMGQIGARFNAMAGRVQDMVEGQKRLVAGVSHELRTPLTRMRLLSEIVRDGGGEGRRLDDLDREIALMDGIVGELLEAARLEQGPGVLMREEVLVSSVVEEARERVDLGGRPVSIGVAPDLRFGLDRSRVLRALENVFSNIARYTSDGCAVRVDAALRGRDLVITVEDDGPGVPASEHEGLFEPFHRREQSRSKASGGLGLGLTLVRQIARAHGGDAHAEATQSGGLRLVLRFGPLT